MDQSLDISVPQQVQLVLTNCVRCHKRIFVYRAMQPFCRRCAYILGVTLEEARREVLRQFCGDEAEAASEQISEGV